MNFQSKKVDFLSSFPPVALVPSEFLLRLGLSPQAKVLDLKEHGFPISFRT
jgi:hypothetical protein